MAPLESEGAALQSDPLRSADPLGPDGSQAAKLPGLPASRSPTVPPPVSPNSRRDNGAKLASSVMKHVAARQRSLSPNHPRSEGNTGETAGSMPGAAPAHSPVMGQRNKIPAIWRLGSDDGSSTTASARQTNRMGIPKNMYKSSKDAYKPSEYTALCEMATQDRLSAAAAMAPPSKITRLLALTDPELTTMALAASQPRTFGVPIDRPVFRATPSRVYLQNWQAFQSIQIEIEFQNEDSVTRQMYVEAIPSPFWNIRHKRTSSLASERVAPGMSTVFVLDFKPHDKREYRWDLSVVTEREKFILPLLAVADHPMLDVPDMVNFERCLVNHPNMRTLFVRNVGAGSADFKFSLAHPCFQIRPQNGALGPNETMQFELEYQAQHVSDLDEASLLLTYANGDTLSIHLTGSSYEGQLRLQRSSVEMVPTFLNQTTFRVVRLFNHMDTKVHFSWHRLPSAEHDRLEHDREKTSLAIMNQDGGHADSVLNAERLRQQLREIDGKQYLFPTATNDFSVESASLETFSITPQQGVVWPNSYTECSVIFVPKEDGQFDATAYCKIGGRVERLVFHMTGRGHGPNLHFIQQDLVQDLKKIYMGHSITRVLHFENMGDIDAPWKMIMPPNSPCTFKPEKGVVPPRANAITRMTFKPQGLGFFDHVFNVAVEKAEKGAFVRVKAEVVVPECSFDLQHVDFGAIAYGFSHTQALTLMNSATVPLHFSLRVAPNVLSVDTERSQPTGGASTDDPEEDMLAGMKRPPQFAITTPQWIISPSIGQVPPNSQIQVEVQLTPQSQGLFEGALVLDVVDVNTHVAAVTYKAESIAPKISLVPWSQNFGETFIHLPYVYNAVLTNDTPYAAEFCLLQPEEREKTHSIMTRNLSGTIPAHGSTKVAIEFQIRRLGPIEIDLAFLIRGHSEPLVAELTCRGIGPRLRLEATELDWGKIPVLTHETRTVVLRNEGQVPALFNLQLLAEDTVFKAEPTQATLNPGQTVTITITAFLDDATKFVDILRVLVAHSKPEEVRLKARGTGTTVIFDENIKRIDMGTVLTTNVATREFTVHNKGRRPAMLLWMTSDVFQVIPARCMLKPNTKEVMSIRGSLDVPAEVEEQFLLFALMENDAGKQLLHQGIVGASFINPTLTIVPASISLLAEHESSIDSPFKLIQQVLTLTNPTELNLEVELRAGHPFVLSETKLTLMPEQAHEITISYDTAVNASRRSVVDEKRLAIRYQGHPHRDFVRLTCDCRFPNLKMSVTHIDFGAILPGSEVSHTFTMTNPGHLPAFFEWGLDPSFFNKPCSISDETHTVEDVTPWSCMLPYRGVIHPNQTHTFTVMGIGILGHDAFENVNHDNWICNVLGGPTYTLSTAFSCALVQYHLSTRHIDFGDMHMEVLTERRFQIFNTGRVPARFDIMYTGQFVKDDVNNPYRIHQRFIMIPPSGEIPSGGVQTIRVIGCAAGMGPWQVSFQIRIAPFEPETLIMSGNSLETAVLPIEFDGYGPGPALFADGKKTVGSVPVPTEWFDWGPKDHSVPGSLNRTTTRASHRNTKAQLIRSLDIPDAQVLIETGRLAFVPLRLAMNQLFKLFIDREVAKILPSFPLITRPIPGLAIASTEGLFRSEMKWVEGTTEFVGCPYVARRLERQGPAFLQNRPVNLYHPEMHAIDVTLVMDLGPVIHQNTLSGSLWFFSYMSLPASLTFQTKSLLGTGFEMPFDRVRNLSQGEAIELKVVFRPPPKSKGMVEARSKMFISNTAQVPVIFRAQVVAHEIHLNARQLTFEDIVVGQRSTRRVVLKNTGALPYKWSMRRKMRFTQQTLTGLPHPDAEQASNTMELPHYMAFSETSGRLEAGESTAILISYEPTSIKDSSEMAFLFQVNETPDVQVPLRITTTAAQHEVVFSPPELHLHTVLNGPDTAESTAVITNRSALSLTFISLEYDYPRLLEEERLRQAFTWLHGRHYLPATAGQSRSNLPAHIYYQGGEDPSKAAVFMRRNSHVAPMYSAHAGSLNDAEPAILGDHLLEAPDLVAELFSHVVVLHGPPKAGKTTLATTIQEQRGYEMLIPSQLVGVAPVPPDAEARDLSSLEEEALQALTIFCQKQAVDGKSLVVDGLYVEGFSPMAILHAIMKGLGPPARYHLHLIHLSLDDVPIRERYHREQQLIYDAETEAMRVDLIDEPTYDSWSQDERDAYEHRLYCYRVRLHKGRLAVDAKAAEEESARSLHPNGGEAETRKAGPGGHGRKPVASASAATATASASQNSPNAMGSTPGKALATAVDKKKMAKTSAPRISITGLAPDIPAGRRKPGDTDPDEVSDLQSHMTLSETGEPVIDLPEPLMKQYMAYASSAEALFHYMRDNALAKTVPPDATVKGDGVLKSDAIKESVKETAGKELLRDAVRDGSKKEAGKKDDSRKEDKNLSPASAYSNSPSRKKLVMPAESHTQLEVYADGSPHPLENGFLASFRDYHACVPRDVLVEEILAVVPPALETDEAVGEEVDVGDETHRVDNVILYPAERDLLPVNPAFELRLRDSMAPRPSAPSSAQTSASRCNDASELVSNAAKESTHASMKEHLTSTRANRRSSHSSHTGTVTAIAAAAAAATAAASAASSMASAVPTAATATTALSAAAAPEPPTRTRFVLGPGESREVTVRFSSVFAGRHLQTFHFATDLGMQDVFALPVVGQAHYPALESMAAMFGKAMVKKVPEPLQPGYWPKGNVYHYGSVFAGIPVSAVGPATATTTASAASAVAYKEPGPASMPRANQHVSSAGTSNLVPPPVGFMAALAVGGGGLGGGASSALAPLPGMPSVEPASQEAVMRLNVSNHSDHMTMFVHVGFSAPTDHFALNQTHFEIAPGHVGQIAVAATPRCAGVIQETLLLCLRDNPEPFCLNIACIGVRAEMAIDRRHISFDHVALNVPETRRLQLTNPTVLPLRWRLVGLETLGDEMTIAPTEGVLAPTSDTLVNLVMRSAKSASIKKTVKLEVLDGKSPVITTTASPLTLPGDGAAVVPASPSGKAASVVQEQESVERHVCDGLITFSGEAVELLPEFVFPKGDRLIDLETLRVNEEGKQTFTLRNKGRYDFSYRMLSHAVTGLTFSPESATIAPERSQTVTVALKSPVEVDISHALRCHLYDPMAAQVSQMVDIKLLAKIASPRLSVTPVRELNFGSLPMGNKVTKTLTLENTGSLDFRFQITRITDDWMASHRNALAAAGAGAPTPGAGPTSGPAGPGSRHPARYAPWAGAAAGGSTATATATGPKPARLAGAMAANAASKASNTAAIEGNFGSFAVTPLSGSLPPGASQVITVEFMGPSDGSQAGVAEEVMGIDCYDRITATAVAPAGAAGPVSGGGGGGGGGAPAPTQTSSSHQLSSSHQPTTHVYHLLAESCACSIDTSDWSSIFEELPMVEKGRPCNGLQTYFSPKDQTLYFGRLLINETISARVKVKNTAKVPCDVVIHLRSKTKLLNAPAQLESVMPGSAKAGGGGNSGGTITTSPDLPFETKLRRLTLQAHESRFVTITFTPQMLASFQAVFEAMIEGVSDHNAHKTLQFDLVGEGTLPRLTADPQLPRDKNGAVLLRMRRTLVNRMTNNVLELTNDGDIDAHLRVEWAQRDPCLSLTGYQQLSAANEVVASATMSNLVDDTMILLLGVGQRLLLEISCMGSAPAKFESELRVRVVDNSFEDVSVAISGEIYFERVVMMPLDDDVLCFEDAAVDVPAKKVLRLFNATQETLVASLPMCPQVTFLPPHVVLRPDSETHVTAVLNASPTPQEYVRLALPPWKYGSANERTLAALADGRSLDEAVRIGRRSIEHLNRSGVGGATGGPATPSLLGGPQNGPAGGKADTATAPATMTTATTAAAVELEHAVERPMWLTATIDRRRWACDVKALSFKATNMLEQRVISLPIRNAGHNRLVLLLTMHPVPGAVGVPPAPRSDRETHGMRGTSAATAPATAAVTAMATAPPLVPFSVSPSAISVAPGETETVQVRFTPDDARHYEARLVGTHPDGAGEPLVLPVSGLALRPIAHFAIGDATTPRGDAARPSGLNVGPETHVLRFASCGLKNKVVRRFPVINTTDQPLAFVWRSLSVEPASGFQCLTPEGQISPGKQIEMAFEFVGQTIGIEESLWEWCVDQTTERKSLLLVGETWDPVVFIKEPVLNFGNLLSGKAAKQTLTLMNAEEEPLAYNFSASSVDVGPDGKPILAVSPSTGTIGPKSQLLVDVTLTPSGEKQYAIRLACHVRRRQNPLYVTVRGEAYVLRAKVTLDGNVVVPPFAPAASGAAGLAAAGATATTAGAHHGNVLAAETAGAMLSPMSALATASLNAAASGTSAGLGSYVTDANGASTSSAMMAPAVIDFARVQVGDIRQSQIAVHNTGSFGFDAHVSLRGMSGTGTVAAATGSPISALQLSTQQLSLPRGGRSLVTLMFRPTAPLRLPPAARLVIAIVGGPAYHIPISGLGYRAVLSWSMLHYRFEPQYVASVGLPPAQVTFVATNDVTSTHQPLADLMVDFSQAPPPAGFLVRPQQFVIAPKAQVAVTVLFVPSEPRVYREALTYTLNGLSGGTLQVEGKAHDWQASFVTPNATTTTTAIGGPLGAASMTAGTAASTVSAAQGGLAPVPVNRKTTLDFGAVMLGDASHKSLHITNNSSVMSLALALDPATATLLAQHGIRMVPPGPLFLKPKTRQTLRMTYQPTLRQSLRQRLVFRPLASTAGAAAHGAAAEDAGARDRAALGLPLPATRPALVAELTGSCLAAEVAFESDQVAFGAVVLGGQIARKAFLINSGDIGLQFEVKIAADRHFTLLSPQGYVAPGSDYAVDVVFHPHGLGEHRTRMVCVFENGISLTLAVTGTGVAPVPSDTVIRFRAPQGATDTQAIPITNRTSQPWTLRPVFERLAASPVPLSTSLPAPVGSVPVSAPSPATPWTAAATAAVDASTSSAFVWSGPEVLRVAPGQTVSCDVTFTARAGAGNRMLHLHPTPGMAASPLGVAAPGSMAASAPTPTTTTTTAAALGLGPGSVASDRDRNELRKGLLTSKDSLSDVMASAATSGAGAAAPATAAAAAVTNTSAGPMAAGEPRLPTAPSAAAAASASGAVAANSGPGASPGSPGPVARHEATLFVALPDGSALFYRLQGTVEKPQARETLEAEVACKETHVTRLTIDDALATPSMVSVRSPSASKTVTTWRVRVEPPLADPTVVVTHPETVVSGTDNRIRDLPIHFFAFKEGFYSFRIVLTPFSAALPSTGGGTAVLDESNRFFYQFHYRVGPPQPITGLLLSAAPRQAKRHRITVVNPTSVATTLTPSCSHPDIAVLNGPVLALPAHSEAAIELEYSPLASKPTAATDGVVSRVTACSPHLGTYLWDVTTVVEPVVPEPPVVFHAALGQTQTQTLRLVSRAHQRLDVNVRCDAADFAFDKTLTIPAAAGEFAFEVVFEPSAVAVCAAQLVVSSPACGEWVFPLVGHGEAPKPQGPYVVRPGTTASLPFRNPLHASATFAVTTDPAAVFTVVRASETVGARKSIALAVTHRALAGVGPDKADGGAGAGAAASAAGGAAGHASLTSLPAATAPAATAPAATATTAAGGSRGAPPGKDQGAKDAAAAAWRDASHAVQTPRVGRMTVTHAATGLSWVYYLRGA